MSVNSITFCNYRASSTIYFDSESVNFPSRDCFDSIENTRVRKELGERRDRGEIIHRMEEILQSGETRAQKIHHFSVVCSRCVYASLNETSKRFCCLNLFVKLVMACSDCTLRPWLAVIKLNENQITKALVYKHDYTNEKPRLDRLDRSMQKKIAKIHNNKLEKLRIWRWRNFFVLFLTFDKLIQLDSSTD